MPADPIVAWIRAWFADLFDGLNPQLNQGLPLLCPAGEFSLNEPGGWTVHRDQTTYPREEADSMVALAKSISRNDSSSQEALPKRPPKMVPLSKYRQDAATRMRSIEQREYDAELIRRIQAGEPELYKDLVLKYQQKVYGVAWGMVQNPEDAREISQDAFIKAFKSLDRFRFDASFYTWLYRITVNLSIDFRRKAVKRRTNEFDDTRMQKDEAGEIAQPHMESSPQRRLERKRLADTIQAAIDQLPEDQRTVIMLREVEGLSYKEIAESVGCAEGTVMSRLFYGRKKLQEILKDVR